MGWAQNGRTDAAHAACELLDYVASRLSGIQHSDLTRELLRLTAAVPFIDVAADVRIAANRALTNGAIAQNATASE